MTINNLTQSSIVDSTKSKIATVVQKIRERRMMLNYTQAYVASKLGISQNAYSKIETSLTNFNIERLYTIAEILHVDVKDLL